ncbi:GntR family transcriptional regulator [Actinomycetospora sp. NBRC 106375]|uniref:GntR family transcriptional regulator n=1 Tax=Actinomycetospora sp. NBRC 106375 TaxID=3032207 RepID=UPI0024A2CBA4|nr:GntR family transcriptional regulator [Actinomycetospora sp. NBRC 106375]GLZ49878.1 GntR family transcriptional regulator [Actinomycetospora sp. NBRC 106375]
MRKSEANAATDRRSVIEQAAAQIRERIKYGRLAPGQRLIEADLIGQLLVSRSTIRAAFSQLAAEGIITLERNRGAHVRLLQVDEIQELYELRAVLEGRAAGLVSERAEPACLVEVRELDVRNKDFHDGGSFAEYWSFNEGLHRAILDWCGNDMLRRMAEQTRTLTHHYHLQAAAQGDPGRPVSIDHACEQHQAILEAILSGTPDAAERAMREHVRDNGRSIVAFLEAEQAASTVRPLGRSLG